MRKYIEVIDELEITLNFKSTNQLMAMENKQLFNNCLMELKENFKTDVSTKYLMGFVKGDEKQKSNRVNYMLKIVGLNERRKITDCYLEREPTTTSKEVEVSIYSSKLDKDKNEQIYLKVISMTSHDYRGVKAPCKVGITSRKLRTVTLNQVVL